MILVGNRRGGSSELAAHLLNVEDNEHVELHEVRGFIANDLESALHEAYGISRGTRCKKFLYSLSLSPPQDANVPVEVFEATIERIEQQLGFAGQPRTIVFHEKQGRRHAHVVWSRINSDTMTAIDPYKDKLALNTIARELFIEHQWDMPAGLKRKSEADPLNYTHVEHSQAKRAKRDPKELKRIFKACWEQSDTRDTFANALKEHGLILAKGDRRGFVAVDASGEIYSVARYASVKTKMLRARFGVLDGLPSVDEAVLLAASTKQKHNANLNESFNLLNDSQTQKIKSQFAELEQKRIGMIAEHRKVRAELQQTQQVRHISEVKARSAKLPKGLRGIWFKMSGQYEALVEVHQLEAKQCEARDRSERQTLIENQLSERRQLQQELQFVEAQLKSSDTHILSIDPAQALIIPPDPELLTIKDKVNYNPEHILEVLTNKQESFSRNDILRGLAKYIDDPLKLGPALEQVMRSSELVVLDDEEIDDDSHADRDLKQAKQPDLRVSRKKTVNQRYSTRSFQKLKLELEESVQALSATSSTFVSKNTINAAIKQQNKLLKEQMGVTLSDQQKDAIHHGLNNKQLTAIVGLAGTGKSTILSVVKTALDKQGYKVHGAALSGKAADGLEQASGIKSRTLASWMRSWDQGNGLLNSNDLLIIDETGMIGTKQLLRFIKEAKRSGAKLLLVGDPEQLQPINAGTPFRDICNVINPAELTEIHRQKENWQKQASLDLAEQRTEQALATYEAHGKVIETKDTSEAIMHLVEDYMIDLELDDINKTASSRLALAHRRKDVHAINQAIRIQRKAAGDLQEADEALIQTEHGKRTFAKGDRIVFTKNDRELGVKNGMLGTVQLVDQINSESLNNLDNDQEDNQNKNRVTKAETSIVIKLDGEPARTITLNPSHYASFDHGYATTIHKSQGITVDKAFVLGSTTMDRHLTYVAMTRHREDVTLYADKHSLRKMRYSISTWFGTENNSLSQKWKISDGDRIIQKLKNSPTMH